MPNHTEAGPGCFNRDDGGLPVRRCGLLFENEKAPGEGDACDPQPEAGGNEIRVEHQAHADDQPRRLALAFRGTERDDSDNAEDQHGEKVGGLGHGGTVPLTGGGGEWF